LIEVQRVKKGRRYDIQINHGFRKRTNTILKLESDVNSNIAEKILGHKNGLDGVYLAPTRQECFKEFCKGIVQLTISDSERQKIEIKKLEEEKSEIAELRKRIDEFDVSAKMLHGAIKEGYVTVDKTDTGVTLRWNNIKKKS